MRPYSEAVKADVRRRMSLPNLPEREGSLHLGGDIRSCQCMMLVAGMMLVGKAIAHHYGFVVLVFLIIQSNPNHLCIHSRLRRHG